MIKRIIDISEQAYLHLKNWQLLIDKKGEPVAQIPVEDLGVLILQHPALGLQHHNQYNGLCLADDLMEPFRPWIDFQVFQITGGTPQAGIETASKKKLLSLLNEPVEMRGLTMPMMIACHYLMADLKRAFQDKTVKLDYPVLKRMETE